MTNARKSENLAMINHMIQVELPTIESLLGDKLTAFAPTTTGVKLRRRDNEPGEIMQVAKQLFDIGVLFEQATDFMAVARAYDGVQAQESGYRENLHTREASLDDTIKACLGLSALRVRKAPTTIYPDADLMFAGTAMMHTITQLSQHSALCLHQSTGRIRFNSCDNPASSWLLNTGSGQLTYNPDFFSKKPQGDDTGGVMLFPCTPDWLLEAFLNNQQFSSGFPRFDVIEAEPAHISCANARIAEVTHRFKVLAPPR